MAATVVCFERFRQERDRQHGEKSEGVTRVPDVSFLRQPGVALTARQAEHRRAMLVNLGAKG